ncbi:MAG: hypothetical protein DWQ19_10470 [Crenarchaeota archaeon]|nr:MAG: hypothetical protein DWQ19_10470 [Thermoproteota archaeon]
MVKKYDPIRVVNPTDGHLVPLLPDQDFIISVHRDDDETPEVDYNSPFFEMTHTEVRKKEYRFHFEQKYSLRNWGKGPRTFLGNVFILTEKYLGSLCVFLETNNKLRSGTLSIINPTRNYVKVNYPYTLLEVVIFDEEGDADWESTVFSSKKGLKYELFKREKFNPLDYKWAWDRVTENLLSLPRNDYILDNSVPKLEHHYWFRPDSDTFKKLHNAKPGVYSVGDLFFINGNQKKYIELDIRVKARKPSYVSPSFKEGSNGYAQKSSIPTATAVTTYVKPSLYKQVVSIKERQDDKFHSSRIRYF